MSGDERYALDENGRLAVPMRKVPAGSWAALRPDEREAIEERAYTLGHDYGASAASWYFAESDTLEDYERTLRGIRECDPAVFDTFPSAPLSGEWADSPLPRDVLHELGLADDDDDEAGVLRFYEDGFGVAVADTIERACLKALEPGEAAGFDTEPAYRRAGWGGVAWRVTKTLGPKVYAHMIGDDEVFVIEPAELTPIGDDEYCASCGQIGCGHGARERG